MIDFVQLKTFLYIGNTCKQQRFTANTVHSLYKLAESHVMPGTNQQTPGCDTSRKHTQINIFKTPKSKSEIAEHKNEKKKKTYEGLFFSFMRLCSKSPACNRKPQFFRQLQSFVIATAIMIATHGQNTLH